MATDVKLSHEELRLLYQVTVSDLAYFKTQQWSVTNYALVLLAGLVAVAQFLRPGLSPMERWVLVGLAVAIGIGSLIVLFKLQKSISVRKSRLEFIRESFSSAFNRAWAAEVKGREYFHSVYFLCAVVVGGASVVTWLVLRA